MKIAVLNWRDHENPAAGGAELFVHEVARRWVDQGHSVTLVASRFKGSPRTATFDGVEVVRVGNLRAGTHHVRALNAVRRLDGVDLLLESVNTIPYWVPSRRTDAAKIVTLVHQLARDVWASHLRWSFAARAASWVEPKLYLPYRSSETGTVAAVSRSTADDLGSIGIKNAEVVPQGGVGEQPRPAKENRPTLIFVGRQAANKRPDHALDAFELIRRSLPDCQMWVVGEGPMKTSLASRRVKGVNFFPRLPRAELLDRMGRAHLLLATSVREGWGLVVTEANAVGTPAIAYDVAGLRDSIRQDETGLLVEQDPQKLADAAVRLLGDPQRYDRMRNEAIDWGRSFTWDRTARALLDLGGISSPALEEMMIDERA